jgi:hypothetical protein
MIYVIGSALEMGADERDHCFSSFLHQILSDDTGREILIKQFIITRYLSS